VKTPLPSVQAPVLKTPYGATGAQDFEKIRRIDPDFKIFLANFLARKAWLPFVERELVKLFALKEDQQ
jgi:hypothetical protein